MSTSKPRASRAAKADPSEAQAEAQTEAAHPDSAPTQAQASQPTTPSAGGRYKRNADGTLTAIEE